MGFKYLLNRRRKTRQKKIEFLVKIDGRKNAGEHFWNFNFFIRRGKKAEEKCLNRLI